MLPIVSWAECTACVKVVRWGGHQHVHGTTRRPVRLSWNEREGRDVDFISRLIDYRRVFQKRYLTSSVVFKLLGDQGILGTGGREEARKSRFDPEWGLWGRHSGAGCPRQG